MRLIHFIPTFLRAADAPCPACHSLALDQDR